MSDSVAYTHLGLIRASENLAKNNGKPNQTPAKRKPAKLKKAA